MTPAKTIHERAELKGVPDLRGAPCRRAGSPHSKPPLFPMAGGPHERVGPDAADAGKDLDLDVDGVTDTAKRVADYINRFQRAVGNLIDQNKELGGETAREKAEHMRTNVIPAMNEVRAMADRLERITAHDLWPLPTYKQMLFVK